MSKNGKRTKKGEAEFVSVRVSREVYAKAKAAVPKAREEAQAKLGFTVNVTPGSVIERCLAEHL